MASASKAEFGALFLNDRESATIWNTLSEIDHPQLPTHIVTDHIYVVELENDTVKQKRSKAIDMCFI